MGKLFEKIKKGVSYLMDGLYTIGEGMSTITLFPDSEIYIPKRKVSAKKDYFTEGWKTINKSLKKDWEAVGKDLEKVIKEFEK
jgi:hypothetical protein